MEFLKNTKFFMLVAILLCGTFTFAVDHDKLATFTTQLTNGDDVENFDIDDHESGKWGHCVKEHCAKNHKYLQDRNKKVASTFKDKKAAEKAILAVLKKKKSDIKKWMAKSDKREEFRAEVKVKGSAVFEEEKSVLVPLEKELTVIVLLVKKEVTLSGKKVTLCHVRSAYPEPEYKDFEDYINEELEKRKEEEDN